MQLLPAGAKWSIAGGFSYDWILGDAGDLRLSLRHAWRGETRCSDESDAQGTCGVSGVLTLGESQERTDVRLGWVSAAGALGVAVYGSKVFDNQYVDSLGTCVRSVLGIAGARLSEPRTWGVEMKYEF